jgi:two-component system sensor histidine kinase/response regulator
MMADALIMVVEDDLALLEGIRELLELSGYRVLIASNGKEALDLLEKERPDLIISDIMMPEMDGYAFHSAVREISQLTSIPFIFLTARGEKSDIRRGRSSGVDDYITKPFDDEDLLAAIRGKLSRFEAVRTQQTEEIADFKHKILLTLSHEFRTPLTYILNYSDLLAQEGGSLSSEDFDEFMVGIKRGAQRLNRLVEDFLILVELESGEARNAYNFRRAQVEDTSAWLRILARRYTAQAEQRGLELKIEVPDGLPHIVVDEAYLSDAIGRLLENAIKFSDSDSKWVRFSADVDQGQLVIRVQDRGIGIADEDLTRLFDVFHQIDRAKREQQGTGSGLAICRGIVELHGGSLQVESELGSGSIFSLVLPLAPELAST